MCITKKIASHPVAPAMVDLQIGDEKSMFLYRFQLDMKKRRHINKGDTPGKPDEKLSKPESLARKNLFGNTDNVHERKIVQWTVAETSALVQYIGLYWEDNHTDGWPSTKNSALCNSCAGQ